MNGNLARGLFGAIVLLACTGCAAWTSGDDSGDFYAYYTRINSGEPFEQYARVGEFADIIVRLGRQQGKLVFWRGSSYLPFWETTHGKWYLNEVIPRQGDGEGRMPDKVNTYSRVFIIETNPERIVVHWRYLPRFEGTNPHKGFDATHFVDEYFTITGDGDLMRTIKRGTSKYDDWMDPLNKGTQTLKLTATGIIDNGIRAAESSKVAAPRKGSPVKAAVVGAPVKHWRFDEAFGERAKESVAGDPCPIQGHKSYWKKGVSGTALHFDGYNTVVSLPREKTPGITTSLTLEAWIAIGAYPWNWTPIVQQGDDDGYFLGIDGHAYLGFKVRVGEAWEELSSQEQLERNRWYHVAGTFDSAGGVMRLYIDGREYAGKSVAKAAIRTAKADIQIGKGMDRRPIDPVRRNTFVDSYSFDGLIDEVKIYDVALDGGQVARSYENLKPPDSLRDRPDMDRRVLPSGKTTGTFGGSYTHLKFYEVWDGMWRFSGHPDVVVEFDELPTKFVFWRGTGYIPMMVNEKGQWYSNEFNETWGTSGGQGCQEPMSDKEAYTNHARIIENTDARVVVQWRYPLVDVFHVIANYDEDIGWGDWSDWYYYIYPDGVAVKRMRLWTHGRLNHEWHEAMAIFGPDQHPEQIIEKKNTLTLAGLEGKVQRFDWISGPPRIGGAVYRASKVHLVNYKAEYDPFTIADFIGGDVYGGEVTPYAVFPTWNHWPVAQMPSDGRYASFPDRTAHSSLTHAPPRVYRERSDDPPYQERLMMEGMTKKEIPDLVTLARSWLQAPECEAISGCDTSGYDESERAYRLIAMSAGLSFRINASEQRPIENLCFVIKNWGTSARAVLEVDAKKADAGKNFRQGIVRDPQGEQTLILWVKMSSQSPVHFKVKGAEPKPVSTPEPNPMMWEEPPALAGNGLSIRMKAGEATHAQGVEYFFECMGNEEMNSGWRRSPEYGVDGLSPETSYAFRVKIREPYLFTEGKWSEVKAATTGPAPGPLAVWKFDEGAGNTVHDETGNYHGTISGNADWVAGRDGTALRFDGETAVVIENTGVLSSQSDFTWTAWIRTEKGGTILARAGAGREWTPGGKVLFVREDWLLFDVGWVGVVGCETDLDDGNWHFVAVTVDASAGLITFYVDGRPAGQSKTLNVATPEKNLPIKIGFCNDDFPEPRSGFEGEIDDVRWYGYVLGGNEPGIVPPHSVTER